MSKYIVESFGRSGLTEVERQVCEHTAHFEDFMMLFLDKVLIIIENCDGSDATRADAATWGEDESRIFRRKNEKSYGERMKVLFHSAGFFSPGCSSHLVPSLLRKLDSVSKAY